MKIENMTSAQRTAVETDHPNVFCVAGPGSGKTTVLAARIKRLMQDVHPSQILAITYTNAAARNIEQRIESDAIPVGLGYAGTLHGFCLRMLREHGEAAGYGPKTGVIDEEAANELLAAKMATTGCTESLKKVVEMKRLGRPVRKPGGLFSKAQLAILSYMDELAESSLLDFDLILTEFLRILGKQGNLWQAIKDRFDHVLIDEVQDSAATDWAIYYGLPIPNKFLVGDPDQAIFGFRGGRVVYAVRHAMTPGVLVLHLEANFRCGAGTCEAANRLIAHNKGRLEKETIPAENAGLGKGVATLSAFRNEGEEVTQVVTMINGYYTKNDGTTGVLARTNAIANAFREAIEASGTEVETAPRSEMPADWALARTLLEFLAQPNNDTLAFFYLVARNQRDGATPSEARKTAAGDRRNAQAQGVTLNKLWFGVGESTTEQDNVWVSQTAGHFADKEGLCRETCMIIAEMAGNLPPHSTMLDLALEAASRSRPPIAPPNGGVTVTTIHDAKGREWDEVYLVGMEDEVTPGHRKTDGLEEIEEERRLFFVALTRSRGNVWITHSATRRAQWGMKPLVDHKPSRFIAEALT